MNINKTGFIHPSAFANPSSLLQSKQPMPVDVKPQGTPQSKLAMIDLQARPTLNAARTPATTSQPSDPCQGAAAAAPPQPLTLEELQGAFGTSNRRCDLDSNGIVDMDDLVAFINSQQSTQPLPTTDALDANPTTPVDKPAVIDTTKQGNIAVDTTDAAGADATTAPSTGSNSLTIDGFHKAWGQSGSDYDLNSDGTVNMDDLVQFITGSVHGRSSPNDATRPGESRSATAAAQTNPRKSDQLIATLMNRLDTLGFANQPPVNIRDLIQSMDLTPSQSNDAIRQLQQKYPHGLGVNLVG